MKKIKKLAAVVLSSSLMTALFSLVSFAGDQTTIEQAVSDGKLFDFIKMLLSNVDWASIFAILRQTIQTIIDMLS